MTCHGTSADYRDLAAGKPGLVASSMTPIAAMTMVAPKTAPRRPAPPKQTSPPTATPTRTPTRRDPRRSVARWRERDDEARAERGERCRESRPEPSEPMREATDPATPVVVEVGQHVGEVRSDPDQRTGHHRPHRRPGVIRQGPASRQPADRRTRSRTAPVTRPSTWRRRCRAIRNRPRSDGPAPARQPSSIDSTTQAAQRAAVRSHDQPCGQGRRSATGLSDAPADLVAGGVPGVVRPADRQLAGQHRRRPRSAIGPRRVAGRSEQADHHRRHRCRRDRVAGEQQAVTRRGGRGTLTCWHDRGEGVCSVPRRVSQRASQPVVRGS